MPNKTCKHKWVKHWPVPGEMIGAYKVCQRCGLTKKQGC